MAITITTQTVNGANVVIAEQTGGTGVAIAIDYSFLYDRIADTLDSITANVASIKTTLSSISGNTATIATEITTIDTSLSQINANISTIQVNSTIMKNYGTGTIESFTYSSSTSFTSEVNLATVPANQLTVTVDGVETTNYTLTNYTLTLNFSPTVGAIIKVSTYGKGVHITNPYDSFGAISLYRLYA